jgi:hypothetical protein
MGTILGGTVFLERAALCIKPTAPHSKGVLSTEQPSLSAKKGFFSRYSNIIALLKLPFKTKYFKKMSHKRMARLALIALNLVEIGLIAAALHEGHNDISSNASRTESYHTYPSAWSCIIYILWFDYRSAANLKVLMSVIPR